MKTSSSKAKGRGGQQEIRDRLLQEFPELQPDDIRSTAMGQNGVDLLLSPAAFKLLPISPEIKRRKTLKTLYDWYEQAEKHEGNPVVFFRGDRKKWLVMLDLEYFLELLKGVKSTKTKTYRIKPQG